MDLGSLPCLHANHAGVAPRPLAEKDGLWPPTARCPRNEAWQMCGSVSGLPPPQDKLARRLEIVTTISAVSMNANFRLKRVNVSSDERDPGLNHGFAYVVENTPFSTYLATYGEKIPDDKSTCNNHDAIKSAS